MVMNRSKIETVDELRRLGLWEQASLLKDEIKQRLIDEGLSRREANRKAWEQMSEEFSGNSLLRHQVLQTVVMGEFPPEIEAGVANHTEEPDFDLTWELWCLSLARLECWESDDFEAARAVAARITQVDNGLDEDGMVLSALFEVNYFVQEFAAPKFAAVVHRLQELESTDKQYTEELQTHIREMARFGASVEAVK